MKNKEIWNLAKELGVNYQTILNIANKKTKKPKFKIEWEDSNG